MGLSDYGARMSSREKDKAILAVETSSAVGSVALALDGQIVDERTFASSRRHGVELLPTIDAVLAAAGLTPDRIAAVYISAGPGSFTGLRVGFTFARVLGQVHGARLVPVSTCDVIVENLRGLLAADHGPLHAAAVLDAKRGQVYAAGFRWSADAFEKVIDDRAIHPAELLAALPRPLWIVGEGIDYHLNELRGPDVVIADREYWRPRAAGVFVLGRALDAAGRYVKHDQLVPTYIRLPEPEEKYRAGQLKLP